MGNHKRKAPRKHGARAQAGRHHDPDDASHGGSKKRLREQKAKAASIREGEDDWGARLAEQKFELSKKISTIQDLANESASWCGEGDLWSAIQALEEIAPKIEEAKAWFYRNLKREKENGSQ